MTETTLHIYQLDGEPTVEAYHLAVYLGYTQQGSLRKQILTDWAEIFQEGPDYRLIHDEAVLKAYEDTHRMIAGPISSMKPARGRLFLRSSGLEKVLARTSKNTDRVVEELNKAGLTFTPAVAVPLAPSQSETAGSTKGFSGESQLEQPSLELNPQGVPSDLPLEPKKKLEQLEGSWATQKFKYEVLEKLLEHLKSLEDPTLRGLALLAAETGLGYPLTELRNRLETTTTPDIVTGDAQRPFPDEWRRSTGVYFSLTKIGQAAGGYSAVAAGMAANAIAKPYGFSHEELRQTQLPFNELVERELSPGKSRVLVRFSVGFAKAVIKELKENPKFKPMTGRQDPVSGSASSSGSGFLEPSLSVQEPGFSYPNLSRGPLES